MKKIVALVLGLALVLTMAFAGTSVVGAAGDFDSLDTQTKNAATASDTLSFTTAVAPTKNSDGKITAAGNVAYFSLANYGGKEFIEVGTKGQADVVLYAKNSENVVKYLAEIQAENQGDATVFNNFGTKCGQVKFTPVSGKTYYLVNDVNGSIYVGKADGAVSVMVGNVLTRVDATPVATLAADTVKHAATPVVEGSKITGYKCAICGLAAIEAPNYASIPSGADNFTGLYYFPANATGATPTAPGGVNSPKTFDAGIAMYAGLALMSVAGSAVVIGKKKEF